MPRPYEVRSKSVRATSFRPVLLGHVSEGQLERAIGINGAGACLVVTGADRSEFDKLLVSTPGGVLQPAALPFSYHTTPILCDSGAILAVQGSDDDEASPLHAVCWIDGQSCKLPPLPDHEHSVPLAMTANGSVIGYCYSGDRYLSSDDYSATLVRWRRVGKGSPKFRKPEAVVLPKYRDPERREMHELERPRVALSSRSGNLLMVRARVWPADEDAWYLVGKTVRRVGEAEREDHWSAMNQRGLVVYDRKSGKVGTAPAYLLPNGNGTFLSRLDEEQGGGIGGVNDHGDIVGHCDGKKRRRATLWLKSGQEKSPWWEAIDLNLLVPTACRTLPLTRAVGINNSGQILCEAAYGGHTLFVRLDPIK